MSKVLVSGLGHLGSEVLQTLARAGVTEIIGADVDEKVGKQKVNESIMTNAALGIYPKIQFRLINLNDVQGTAELLKELQPDLIFNSADRFPFWRFHNDLPREIAWRIAEASPVGFCAALPFRLSLPYNLMKAVKESGTKPHVLITNDPCEVINPMLDKVGLAPTTGIGDFAHFVEPIRQTVSLKLTVPMRSVRIFLVAHHSTLHLFQRRITPDKSTYFLKVLVDDKEITKNWRAEDILLNAVGGSRSKETGERPTEVTHEHHYTAALAVGDMLAILNDTGEIRHCPGPSGLQGGYPVRLSAKGAEVYLPEEITLREATRMNTLAQKQEGIEEIKDDGTVVFTKQAVEIMSEVMNWDLKEFNVRDCEKVAQELEARYREFVKSVRISGKAT
jgi:hypothetical protein